jgi:hypothetical protein
VTRPPDAEAANLKPSKFASLDIFGYLLLLERKAIPFFNLKGFESNRLRLSYFHGTLK